MSKLQSTSPNNWRRLAVISGLLYGLPMSVWFSIQSGRYAVGLPAGIVAGVFFGILFSWLMSTFARRQAARFKVERPDFGSETIVYEGPANNFKGAEGVGGYLWLTGDRIHFASHKFNLQNHEWTARFPEIAAVEAVRTVGVFNNGLLVHLTTGEKERFVVNDNSGWAAAIEHARRHNCGFVSI
ncbi:MAG: hypothetical protein AB7G28_03980 [Pirellulales bacterium]